MPDASFPFSDPFLGRRQYSRAVPGRPPHFHTGFTDPYMLFNTIFGDLSGREFGPRSRSTPHNPFHDDDMFGISAMPTPPILRPMGIGFPAPFEEGHGRRSRSVNSGMFSYESSSFSARGGGGGDWVSQSRSTRTVNGVTESEWRRIDADVSPFTLLSPFGFAQHMFSG
jgi:DnaJ homolog subfamily B member 6